MHTMFKVAVIATTLGLVSTGFASEKLATQAEAASTQTATTTPATPTSDQVLKGSAASNSTSQTTGQPNALTHDHGHDEDMD